MLEMADVIICLSSLPGLVFPREDSATCSPLITYSVKTLFLACTHTHRNQDADIHGCTVTHIHMRQDFIGPLLIPPLGVIVHGCVCFPGPQTQTVMGRGGGGGLRGDQRMERVGEGHTKMKLDAIITVCLWFNGCFCS